MGRTHLTTEEIKSIQKMVADGMSQNAISEQTGRAPATIRKALETKIAKKTKASPQTVSVLVEGDQVVVRFSIGDILSKALKSIH